MLRILKKRKILLQNKRTDAVLVDKRDDLSDLTEQHNRDPKIS